MVIRGRNRGRGGQIPSRASPSFANEHTRNVSRRARAGARSLVGGEWLARWPATEQLSLLFSPSSLSIVSSPRPRPPKPAATRRKSLRLTGSHGITGTRDIYASAPTDRSITRNKEIANLLQEENPRPPLPAPSRSPTPQRCRLHVTPLATPVHPGLFPLLRYCPPRSRRGSGPRVISAFMGRDRHGSSGNVPDDGEKSCDNGWRASERAGGRAG